MEHYSFTPPSYTAQGVVKIAALPSGSTAVYKYDDNTKKTISFTFDAQAVAKISGTTGADFGFQIFPFNKAKNQFHNTPVYRTLFNRSTLTNAVLNSGSTFTVTAQVANIYLFPDTQYLLKGFFIKQVAIKGLRLPETPQQPYSMYDEFIQTLYPQQFRFHPKYYNRASQVQASAVTLTSEQTAIPVTGMGLPYGTYDVNKDHYFVSLGNPAKPTPNATSQALGNQVDTFTGTANPVISSFRLSQSPLTTPTVYKNNTLLVLGGGYTADTHYIGDAAGLSFNLTTPLAENDVLSVGYFSNHQRVNLVSNSYVVPSAGAPRGYNNGSGATVFLNENTNNLEILLNGIPPYPNSIRVEANGVNVSGATLGSGMVTIPNYDPAPDATLIVYFREYIATAVDAWPLLMQPTRVDFVTRERLANDATGYFRIQLAAETDYTFTDILFTHTTPYVPGARAFADTFNLANVTGIQPYGRYLLRVTSHKTFHTITNDNPETSSEFDVFLIRLGSLTSGPIFVEIVRTDSPGGEFVIN